MYVHISHKERARTINNSKETAREFAEIAQNETNVLMYVSACVCVRTYLATVQTEDRRRQTEVGRRQKSDNSAAFWATKFSNIFLVNCFFFMF